MAERRYELQDGDLQQRLDALLGAAGERYGRAQGLPLVREILVSGLRLLRDGASIADLKLVNSALKELRHAFRVFAPYAAQRKVAVFGSARTPPGAPDWLQAQAFAEAIVRAGWMVITGAGGGIMAAAQGGAGREASFGVNIRLPFEQRANPVIAGDEKLVNFRYFFTRKVVFVKEAHAIALFPGGYGTHDEGLEALTLIQTGKGEMLPVVFVDHPGGSYWRDWQEYVRTHLAQPGFIDPEDMNLFRVTDDVAVAIDEIRRFYSNYHSSRWVGGRLVLRIHRVPGAEQLEAWNREFAAALIRGRIEVSEPLPEEGGSHPTLPRLVLQLDRRARGRLRSLIDRVNELWPAELPPPLAATRHEIVAEPLPPAARSVEAAEE